MTLAKVKTLYDADFALWLEATVKQLKSGDFSGIDWENLIDEVEALGKRDNRELENMRIEYDANFPDTYPFSVKIESKILGSSRLIVN